MILDPPKVKTQCLLIAQDISALFDVPCFLPRWMILASTRMWKTSLFWTNDIVKLGSMQFQDPENGVSDPTDLAKNLITLCLLSFQALFPSVLPSVGAPRHEETALHESKALRRSFESVFGATIDLQVTFSTGHNLGHEDWFIRPHLTPHSNVA